MTRDASLDEFLGGEDEADAEAASTDVGSEAPADAGAAADSATSESGGGAAADESTEAAAPFVPPEAEPARSTYGWSPGGAECAACGTVVAARWRDDEGLVCPDCKEW